MDRATYFTPDVVDFVGWLAERLCGAPIHFAVIGAAQYVHLHDALSAYAWPPKLKVPLSCHVPGLPYVHPSLPSLKGGSGLDANTLLLSTLEEALRASFSDDPAHRPKLAGAVAAVLHWGGVYTKPGNGAWLLKNHHQLKEILSTFAADHARGNDISKVSELRFNSGMTKVYALLLENFIIYDSRVAASLAWLVRDWWTGSLKRPISNLPEELKFGCLTANGSAAKRRNPDALVFPNLRGSPRRHYTWNTRANWILDSACNQAGKGSRFKSLREVEAALFQMGNHVR